MATDEWDRVWMSDDVSVAKSSFPARAPEIEKLAFRNEEFKTLCQDLAVATEVADRWRVMSGPERDQRLAEYQTLVIELHLEIEHALNNAIVVPFARPKKH